MFEHPDLKGATQYMVQIDLDTSDNPFQHSPLQVSDSFTATMVSGLQIGKSYIWRYCGLVNGKYTPFTGPYRFNILGKYDFEKDSNGLRVLLNDTAQNAGGLIVVDALHAIFDRDGNVVWFMALPGNRSRIKVHTNDLCITKAGTVTFLDDEMGRECDLMMHNLWVSHLQENDPVQRKFGSLFNHDLKRLPNGHYMIIHQDCNWEKLPERFNMNNPVRKQYGPVRNQVSLPGGYKVYTLDNGNLIRVDSVNSYMYVNTGAITEYDKSNNVVWTWKAAEYINPGDIFVGEWTPDSPMINHDPHMNGFSIDEKNEYIYASFRNLSRLVKIERKTGTVVNSWGEQLPSGEARNGHDFFRKQHGPYIMNDGNVMIFNNDFKNPENRPPSVEIFSQGEAGSPSKMLWKYDCAFDSVVSQNYDTRGGNAEVLPNNNLLVCMGEVNRVFEITRDKRITWSTVVVTRGAGDSTWVPLPLYRAHFTSSLYPCYFTLRADNDSLSGNQTSAKLKICNAGSESDSYSITVTSSANSYKIKLNSYEILKRRSEDFIISPVKKPVHGEKIEIVVKSNTNQNLARRLNLVYM